MMKSFVRITFSIHNLVIDEDNPQRKSTKGYSQHNNGGQSVPSCASSPTNNSGGKREDDASLELWCIFQKLNQSRKSLPQICTPPEFLGLPAKQNHQVFLNPRFRTYTSNPSVPYRNYQSISQHTFSSWYNFLATIPRFNQRIRSLNLSKTE